jgi:hypothetical protein
MLTITRTNQEWTASFSNGHLFNRKSTASSPIAALRGLAHEITRGETGPQVQLMADTVNAIADNTMAGVPLPHRINLAEYYYRRVA